MWNSRWAASAAADMTTADRRSRSVPLLIGVAVAVIAADQLAKTWAIDRLSRGDIDLIFDWRLHLVRNPAAAFSLGEGMGPLIGVLAISVVVALVVMSRDYVGWVPTVLVGMIVGGALGNIVDRALRSSDGFFGGEVIDFVDVRFWPVFNVADSAVVLGVMGLAIYSVFFAPEPADEAEAPAATNDPLAHQPPDSEPAEPTGSEAGDDVRP